MAKLICLDTICLEFSHNLIIQKYLLFSQVHKLIPIVCLGTECLLFVFGGNLLGKCFREAS